MISQISVLPVVAIACDEITWIGLVLCSFGAAMREPVITTSRGSAGAASGALAACGPGDCASACAAHRLAAIAKTNLATINLESFSIASALHRCLRADYAATRATRGKCAGPPDCREERAVFRDGLTNSRSRYECLRVRMRHARQHSCHSRNPLVRPYREAYRIVCERIEWPAAGCSREGAREPRPAF